MTDLYKVRDEILEIVKKRQQELQLTFEEEKHQYTMLDKNSVLKDDWYSVSKVIKKYYDEFPAEEIALKKVKGDIEEQQKLLKEWSDAGNYSTNLGSRTHFLLEKKSLEIFDIKKEVRQPIFDCDFEQILKSDRMVSAGENFLELMKQRGAVLLDTEMVLGDNELRYVGQPDKMWLIENKEKSQIGIFCTDYKTNKPKNFESNHFTKPMKYPFNKLPNNALGHYYVQLPLYLRLLFKMLVGSKYENIGLFGAIIVLLKEDGTFEEFRIPMNVITQVFNLKLDL
jgi:hypothetical protein